MAIKQISLFIENKTGRLQKALRILKENQINIRALSLADSTKFGILRLILDQPGKAKEVLEENNFIVKSIDIIAIEVDDNPGGLDTALEILGQHDINVEYVYAFVEKKTEKALVVIKTDDCNTTTQVLRENNISVLESSDITNL